MVALAVLSLVASLVVSSISYGNRVKAMEANYKEIQQISLAAENLKFCTGDGIWDQYRALEKDYGRAVDFSENHTTGDHRRALALMNGSRVKIRDSLTTITPYTTLLIPIGLLIPFVASVAK